MVLLIVITVAYFRGSSAPIESWIGSQLLAIGGSYLNPELHFDRLTYQRPRTVLLDNFSLASPDPAHSGQKVVILAAKQLRLELTEIPRLHQPVKFNEVTLDSPEFRAVAITPGSPGFVGFANLLKGSPPASAPGNSTPAGAAPPTTSSDAGPPMKVSDFLQIHHVEIKNGLILYDPRIARQTPMQLDGINLQMEFAPSTTPGTYAIQTVIDRKPVFQLDVNGQINIDTFTAEFAKLNLALDLQEQNAHFLPPELQALLKSIDLSGQLQIAAKGTLPVSDVRKADMHATVDLAAARAAMGAYRFSIDALTADIDVQNGSTVLKKADARLLGGEIHLAGTMPMDPTAPSHLELDARGIRIEQTIRSVDPNQLPPYAGNIAATVNFTAPLSAWNTQAGGSGTVSLREGRIENLPFLGHIVTTLYGILSKTLGQRAHGLNDTADARFTFAGDHVQVESLTGQFGALALRGAGTIGFDQQLNLRINAGPMEKMQGSLGVVGSIWASASDALAGYRVTGMLTNPQVSLELGNKH
jgi:hypothetical protein